MNRISDDVSKVRMFTGPAIMYSLNLTCMIIMVVSLMFYVNAAITLYVLIPLPILAVTIYLVSDAMNKRVMLSNESSLVLPHSYKNPLQVYMY